MKLLVSQKNKLFSAITHKGFNNEDFIWQDVVDFDDNIVGWKVLFVPDDEYFFYTDHDKTNKALGYLTKVTIIPGFNTYEQNQAYNEIHFPYTLFEIWLDALKRESQQSDLWEKKVEDNTNEIKKHFHEGKEIPNNQPFIEQVVKQILQGIETLNLPPNVQNRIEFNLNQTVNLHLSNKDFDWFSYIIGTITSIIITMSVTPEHGKAIWNIIGTVFRKLIG